MNGNTHDSDAIPVFGDNKFVAVVFIDANEYKANGVRVGIKYKLAVWWSKQCLIDLMDSENRV